jgi:hypothetical protein
VVSLGVPLTVASTVPRSLFLLRQFLNVWLSVPINTVKPIIDP